jgi:signal transduction histidine kinase
VSRFLELARPPELHPAQGSLDDALRRVAPLLTAGVPEGVRVSVHPAGALRAYFDEDAFRQIALNLARNAVEAVTPGGAVRVETRQEEPWAVLEVSDDGPGIPEEDRERVFEFGFSTREGGSGLGLPTVQRLAAELGGSVTVLSAARGGTVVRVTFPSRPHLGEQA